MNQNGNKYHVISNTHWDREWRFPYQRNRQMLVDMIDAVIEILEKEPEYRAFHLDSQAIVLRDYLEVRPQMKETIIRLTKEGRLFHGPWYILPEEFQVGGENLVRNLLLGHKVSNQHGGVSKIGYSPFSWGQVSQLPQIYRQFGVDMIMFYRGINSEDSPKSEFLWRGADGTEMVSSRFSTMPRYNFYFYIYRPVVHNEGFGDVEYPWERGGIPFHFADSSQSGEDFFVISPTDDFFSENIEPAVKAITENQDDDFTTPHKIWMEGHDSSGPNIKTPRIIREIRKKMPNINVVHSTLEDYAREVFSSVDKSSLTVVEGERRSSQNNRRCGNLFGYTTSARMYLKQRNFEAERWAQFYAEPFNVFSAWQGRNICDTYPEMIWEKIVQNSAHDSIGGCSLDAIHEDMMNRYKHSIEMSRGVFERSIKYLVKQIDTRHFSTNDPNPNKNIFLTLINPTAYTRSEVVEAHVDVPVTLDRGAVEIRTANGEKLPVQLVCREAQQHVLEQMIDRPMYFDMVRYHIFIGVKDIPAMGLKSFAVVPVEKMEETPVCDVMENQYLKVTVNEDGTLNILDKKQNFEYKNTAYFTDHGEAGHAWLLTPVGHISTLGKKAQVKKNINGALVQQYEIKHTIATPADLSQWQSTKPQTKKNEVTLTVRLYSGSPLLNYTVDVENNTESHRLRMMFPTYLSEGASSYGEGQFDVVRRATKRRTDTADWVEQPMYDYPMHQFVDVNDAERGFAVPVDGLKEYEVLEDENRTLAITLFRTFEYIINPSCRQDYTYEKGSQMLGHSTYRMASYSHSGEWDTADVYRNALQYNVPMSMTITGTLCGSNKEEMSFVKIEPESLVFSALKKSEDECQDSYVIRLYNPTQSVVKGSVAINAPFKNAEMVTLEEKTVMPLDVQNGKISLTVKPKEIISIKFHTQGK
ncbi:MAG: glycoside hydrolase family 38 C-terminal domain-containing protein [Flavobacteriales bacterium]|nr:glycoside hydrolase family 38 C-terminal domain-containing protein [Flavobacteriales bacterium]